MNPVHGNFSAFYAFNFLKRFLSENLHFNLKLPREVNEKKISISKEWKKWSMKETYLVCASNVNSANASLMKTELSKV